MAQYANLFPLKKVEIYSRRKVLCFIFDFPLHPAERLVLHRTLNQRLFTVHQPKQVVEQCALCEIGIARQRAKLSLVFVYDLHGAFGCAAVGEIAYRLLVLPRRIDDAIVLRVAHGVRLNPQFVRRANDSGVEVD